jgi:DNA polymerase-4
MIGECLRRRANGLDDRPVVQSREAKSIGREHTYHRDTKDRETLTRDLFGLSDWVATALRAGGLRGRTFTLKLRYQNFETHTFSHSAATPSDNAGQINRHIRALLDRNWQSFRKVRLIGVSVSNLDRNTGQMGLFCEGSGRNAQLDRAVDSIRRKHGRDAVKMAGEL